MFDHRGHHGADDGTDHGRHDRTRKRTGVAPQAPAPSASRGTTTRRSAGPSGTSRRSRRPSTAGGAKYISNDAKSSAETQATNVENLISQGANVLIILAQDGTAIKPSVAQRHRRRRPGHRLRPPDRGPERPLHHVRQQSSRQARRPRRSSRSSRRATTSIIKGNKADANADFLRAGMTRQVIRRRGRVDGDIKIVGETYTDNWDPAKAQTEMEQFLTANNNKVDAVLVRERRHGRRRRRRARRPRASPARCRCPARTATRPPSTGSRSARRPSTSGRTPALLGKAAGEAAVAAVQGQGRHEGRRRRSSSHSPGRERHRRRSCSRRSPITKDNLNVVIDAGWITKDNALQGRHRPARSRPAAERSDLDVTVAPCVRTPPGAGRFAIRRLGPRSSMTHDGVRPHQRGVARDAAAAVGPWRSLLVDRDRHPAARHGRRARRSSGSAFNVLSGGDFLTPAQPLEPVGPEHLDRDHGDGHGPDHRVAQHRPVGRLAARLPRLHDGHGPGRTWIPPRRLGLGFDQPYTWVVALASASLLGAADRRAPRAPSSPTAGSPRSSSPSAASSSGAASSSAVRSRGRRSPRSTRPSSCSAAAPRARSASGRAGCSGSSPASGIISASLIAGRRRRRRYGFPVRPMWAEVAIGVVGCVAVLGAVAIANSYRWPRAGRPVRQRTASPSRRRLIIPTGVAYPGRDPDRRDAGDDLPRDPAALRPLRVRVSAATPRRPSSAASTPAGRSC